MSNRESLYKTINGTTSPSWDTMMRILKALDIGFTIKFRACPHFENGDKKCDKLPSNKENGAGNIAILTSHLTHV